MNNPSPNNQRNVRRAVALLAIVLALLLCFQLCKRKTAEDPIPPPTHQETTPTKAAPQHASGETLPKERHKGGLRTRKDAGRKGIKRRTNTEPTTPRKEEKYGHSRRRGRNGCATNEGWTNRTTCGTANATTTRPTSRAKDGATNRTSRRGEHPCGEDPTT